VAINLVLDEDAALGGVVGALGGLGSQIVSLRKSEPSLEDVFVELVGRGFDDAGEHPNGDHANSDRNGATGHRDDTDPTADRRADSNRVDDDLSTEAAEPDRQEVAT